MTVYEMTLTLRIEMINETDDLDTPKDWVDNIIEDIKIQAQGIAIVHGDGTIKEVEQ